MLNLLLSFYRQITQASFMPLGFSAFVRKDKTNYAGNLEREHQEYKLKGAQYIAIWRHEYDPLGNRVKTIRPDGHTVELMTYGSGHVHGVLLDQRETIAFERDDLHREIERNQANQLIQKQTYDPAGRLKEQLIAYDEALGKTSPFNQRRYSYDKAGQLTDIADQRRGGLSYRYDPIGRLLEASSGLGKELFAFDPAGNVQPVQSSTANEHPNQPHQVKPPASWTKPPSILDNLMREYVGTHYEYDERGNMTRRVHNGQSTTFKWDAANRMVESVSAEIRTVYRYDALGRRIVKHSEALFDDGSSNPTYLQIKCQAIARKHNLGLTLYGWDGDTIAWESTYGSPRQLNETTGHFETAFDTSRTTHYIYEPNSFVPMMQAVSSGSINLLPTPDYQAMIASPEGYDMDRDPVWNYQAEQYVQQFEHIAYYQCDHLGTPQELTDMNGEAIWTAQYKAWGEARAVLNDAAKRAGFTNPIRFQGQYFDHETGLHYNRHRYYDPHSGRFVSRDPIGLKGGMNLHGYAPNPVTWVDPNGLCSAALNRALGGVTGDKMQAHHLIPEEIWGRRLDFLNAIGMEGKRDTAANGLLMPDSADKAKQMKRKFYHCGSHGVFSETVDAAMGKIKSKYDEGKLSKSEAAEAVGVLQQSLRATLSAPGTKPVRLF